MDSIKTCQCGGDNYVIDVRVRKSGVVGRRRYCKSCYKRFSTVEITIEEFDAMNRKIKNFNKLKEMLRES